MKRFIYKTIFFLLPLACLGVLGEYFVRQVPNDYSFKNDYLTKHAQDVEVLVFGSSHTLYGLNPKHLPPHTFNAAHEGQTLEYDYFIYEKFKDQMTNLQVVVLPVSYFSLFYDRDEKIWSWAGVSYSLYYGCTYSNAPVDRLEMLTQPYTKLKRVAKYFWSDGEEDGVTVSDLGYGLRYLDAEQDDLAIEGKAAAKRHTRESYEKLDANIELLDRFIRDCAKKNVRVLLFTPPAWKTYTEHLNLEQLAVMKRSMADLTQKHPNASYHSFLNDKRFVESDYRDADHLNEAGAKKFSKILSRMISVDSKMTRGKK